MEEMVNNIVNNTFKTNNIETAKKIIIDKILWYEMKLLQYEVRNKELEEEIENWKFTKKYVEENYIDKSKIKEILETSTYPDFALSKLYKLLEEK